MLRTSHPAGGDSTATHAAIEMVASYGMAVGAEVFDTCVWIGRFHEAIFGGARPHLPARGQAPPLRHAKAKDANITQALVDRFAPGQPNRGKGTKAAPGFFYGFAADMWQAYALAVLVADRLHDGRGSRDAPRRPRTPHPGRRVGHANGRCPA